VTTALLATLGALISYQGGATQNDALLFKNEAAIKKTEASDQWNYYQAKSNKQNLAELGATLTTGDVSRALQVGSEALQRREEGHPEEGRGAREGGLEANARSEQSMHVHHRWAQSMTLIQVAIALGGDCAPDAQEVAAVGRLSSGRGQRGTRRARPNHI
jgi:hypothetical protein